MKTMIMAAGIIMLLLAAGAYVYVVQESAEILGGIIEGTVSTTPYRQYALALLIGGIVLLIVGGVMGRR